MLRHVKGIEPRIEPRFTIPGGKADRWGPQSDKWCYEIHSLSTSRIAEFLGSDGLREHHMNATLNALTGDRMIPDGAIRPSWHRHGS